MSIQIKNVIEKLSGKDNYGKSKAYFSLSVVECGTDGTIQELEQLFIDKPVINIFRSLNQVVVDFIYDSVKDNDLLQQWDFINRYYSPRNSVFYSGEEIKEKQDAKEVLYSKALILNVTDKETNGKYSFENFDDCISFNLISERPGETTNIIRMIYESSSSLFVELDDVSYQELQQSAIRSAENETCNEF